MQVDILSPDKMIYTGEVDAVQLPGIDGLFEILKGHAPMIAALGNGNVRLRSNSGEENFTISGGIVEVIQDKVAVLVEGAIN